MRTENGAVHLDGKVQSDSEKLTALNAVRAVDGVQSVADGCRSANNRAGALTTFDKKAPRRCLVDRRGKGVRGPGLWVFSMPECLLALKHNGAAVAE